ncbi:MAG: NAD(P)/FAD-dependent oxidoreductase [Alphaproteobacteria bacterium]
MPRTDVDALIVGAGFSGIYMLKRCRELGLRALVIEAASDVGGTWYWNRYPGARCDVESMTYSYSFSDDLQREWTWTERYGKQPEILRYIAHVVERFDLRRDMQFETRATAAAFDDTSNRWAIETDRGETISAKYCIMATGCLSTPAQPDFKGLDSFEGETYHTGRWPHEEIDFTGKRVGIVGTGSSAVQSIPVIAAKAAHLTVFQRTPNFSVPAFHGPLDADVVHMWQTRHQELRERARASRIGDIFEFSETSALDLTPEAREAEFERRWGQGSFNFLGSFADLITSRTANDFAVEFAHKKIRGRVDDPAVADLLCPTDHPFGTKRLCVDSDYYETYNRANVSLIDVKAAPIEEITPHGLKAGGKEYELDAIIFATGFDAMTGALLNIDIRGHGGIGFKEKWSDGPRTYLGLAVAGFPNLFTVTGPGSPSVLSNMMTSIEQHIEWIADCMGYMEAHDLATIEADPEAEDKWMDHVTELADGTLFFESNSWYVGANIPGKPRVIYPYVGGVGAYREICDDIAAEGYTGFTLAPAGESVAPAVGA